MATLRTAALKLLRLTGFRLIRKGLHAVMHDITALLAMARRRRARCPGQDFESALDTSPQEWLAKRGLGRQGA